jgi:LacI family transcriptional regulator
MNVHIGNKYLMARAKKKVTMRDVADRVSVSINTVSLTLQNSDLVHPETKARVLEAIQELGYAPNATAQSLRRGIVRTIGIMIPDVHNFHFWDIVDGAEDEAHDRGYSVVLANTRLDRHREWETLRGLLERRYDGVILATTYSEQFPADMRDLVQRGGSVVTLGRTWEGADRISYFREDGALMLLEHLYELGHRRIGFVMGVAKEGLASERFYAYQKFTARHKLPSLIERCGPNIPDSIEATHRLLALDPRPTAIMSVNDYLAVGVYRAVGQHGLRIPDDVSVAGFDNTTMASQLFPSLTSVDVGGRDIGRVAVRLLFERFADPGRPQQIVEMPAQLIIRESTGPVNLALAEGPFRQKT